MLKNKKMLLDNQAHPVNKVERQFHSSNHDICPDNGPEKEPFKKIIRWQYILLKDPTGNICMSKEGSSKDLSRYKFLYF